MKFLLVGINAKYIHSNPAIYSLRAYAEKKLEGSELRKGEVQIELFEATINQPVSEILKEIYSAHADWIGFSCYIWNIVPVRQLAAELRKLLPEVPIWLGGPEASFHEEEILKENPAVTGIMSGEGEETFARLAEAYAQAKVSKEADLQDIPGLCFRLAEEGGESIKKTDPQPALDMSRIPFPYEEMEPFENRIVYYESSRGCPFGCAYCLSGIDRHLRFRDMELVKRELAFFLERKVPQVKFIDRTFNCNHAHSTEILRFLKAHDNGVTNFHFEIAADLLTEEEILLLQSLRPGLVQLEIGVQSTNEETLRAVNRKTDLNLVREHVKRLKQNANIHLHLDLIAGLPGENLESFIRSFNEVYAMGGDELQLGFLKLLKGSPMERLRTEYELVTADFPPYEVLSTRDLSYEEILRLKEVEEMLELYHNSQQFRFTEGYIFGSGRDSLLGSLQPFAFYEKLAAFYKERKEPVLNSRRSRRYEMLMDFFAALANGRGERTEAEKALELAKVRELLTLDYYQRENAKTRPEFAGGERNFKNGNDNDKSSSYNEKSNNYDEKTSIYDFYKKEEQRREFLPGYAEYDWKQMMRMTHLEILTAAKTSTANAVLFDYKDRDPVTGGARMIPLLLEQRRTTNDKKESE